jgi:hypothetical protein
MTIQLLLQGIEDGQAIRRQVAADLNALNNLIGVASARVALHQERGASLPWQAMTTLIVSGLEIRAAARDYTWRASWRKVVARLREQIEKQQMVSLPPTTSPAKGGSSRPPSPGSATGWPPITPNLTCAGAIPIAW